MTPVRYRTVLFDLDGTLIDSGAAILASFHHATETVLGRRFEDEVVMASVGGHGIHRQMAAFDPGRVDELVAAYRAHNLDLYGQIRLFAGVDSVLERLREDGRRLGIVTVKSRATVELTLELLPLGSYFATVVTGDDVEAHKPEPDGLLLALEQLGRGPCVGCLRRGLAVRRPGGEVRGRGRGRCHLGRDPRPRPARARAARRPRRPSRRARWRPLRPRRRPSAQPSCAAFSTTTSTATTSWTTRRSPTPSTTASTTSSSPWSRSTRSSRPRPRRPSASARRRRTASRRCGTCRRWARSRR